MSDRPKEKDRVRSNVNGDHLGHPFEDDGIVAGIIKSTKSLT